MVKTSSNFVKLCWAHILCNSANYFTSFFSSHLCVYNAYKFVLNGPVLTEEFDLYNFQKLDDIFYYILCFLLIFLYRSFRLIHAVVTHIRMCQTVQY